MGLLMLMLVEIADVIGGVIFGSGYSATEVIIVVHRPAAGVIRVAGLVVVAGVDE